MVVTFQLFFISSFFFLDKIDAQAFRDKIKIKIPGFFRVRMSFHFVRNVFFDL